MKLEKWNQKHCPKVDIDGAERLMVVGGRDKGNLTTKGKMVKPEINEFVYVCSGWIRRMDCLCWWNKGNECKKTNTKKNFTGKSIEYNVFYELIIEFKRPITAKNSIFFLDGYDKMTRKIYSFVQKKN